MSSPWARSPAALESFRECSARWENFDATLDALERKGAITTLAEPTLVALSGETASFLAGGEFPVPVIQNGGGSSNNAAHLQSSGSRSA